MRSIASDHKVRLQEDIPIRILCEAVSESLYEYNNDDSARTMAVSCIIASSLRRSTNSTIFADGDALNGPEVFLMHLDGTYDGSFLATASHTQHSSLDVLRLLHAHNWRDLTVSEAEKEVRKFCVSNSSTDILLETWNANQIDN
jgi:20S proteasome alpha/beta subunit